MGIGGTRWEKLLGLSKLTSVGRVELSLILFQGEKADTAKIAVMAVATGLETVVVGHLYKSPDYGDV